MLPIILALVFYYGQSTFWLLQQNFFKYRKVYFVIVLLFSLIFTIADEPDADQHLCERNALIEIAKSPDDVVRLNSDCTVLSWGLITDPESSKNHAELFQIWNITEGQKQFYQGEN